MNKTMIILAATALSLALALTALIAQPYYAFRLSEKLGWASSGYRTTAHAQTMHGINALRASQNVPIEIAFYGASTIEGLDVRRFGAGAVNHAYGGWTMNDVLNEWRANPAALAGRNILLLAGYNDLARGRTSTEITKDVDAMLALRSEEDLTLFIGVLPVNSRGRLGRLVDNEEIAQLNRALAQKCEDVSHCTYVEPQIGPFGFAAPLAAEYDIGDGVHLNAAGYIRLGQLIEAALADLDG